MLTVQLDEESAVKPHFLLQKTMVAGCLALSALAAQAITVGFTCVTNDSAVCPDVIGQVTLDVEDLGSGQATFRLSNAGPLASALTDIYWRSTSLIGGGAIVDSGAGVSFSWGASPANPGGGVSWNASVASDSDSPTAPNGVNPGEWVQFTMGYTGSYDALVAGFDGANQVSIHLQGLGRGGDWAVTLQPPPTDTLPPPIPEPETYMLMIAGLGALAFVARRRRIR